MSSKQGIRIALVGVDSFRGKEIKNVLEAKNFPLKRIEFFDPDVEEEYSKLIEFRGEPRVVLPLDEVSIADSDLVFLASDKKTNRMYGKLAADKNFLAIDLNETFIRDKKVPVVVAGINHDSVLKKKPPLIANPHPVTIVLAHFVNAVCKKFHPKKIAAFILQPASAFEDAGVEELADQSFAVLNSSSIPNKTFKTQVAFSLFSDVAPVDEHGFSSAEKQILSETRSVLEMPDLPLSLAIIQAPVFHTYAVMLHLELEEQADIAALSEVFKKSAYFKVLSPSASHPGSGLQIAGKDEIHIGRIKKEEAEPSRFWVWTITDNLTRGSALNAYEILENSRLI
jgi:aspartate-semialdehyde dehydrogenase